VNLDEHPRPDTTIDALARAFRLAGTGPMPISRGETPAAADATKRARGVSPRRCMADSDASSNAHAPSLMPDVIELNEGFAAQALAVPREWGMAHDAAHVNPNGGAIALGHPLGASGARLIATAIYQRQRTGGRYALCTMCIGVGQGLAVIIERANQERTNQERP
jgi:acetyl-CoA C-acetyltransferase